jgi:hypothetical protein
MIVFAHGCKEPKELKRTNTGEWLASSGLENAPAPVKELSLFNDAVGIKTI